MKIQTPTTYRNFVVTQLSDGRWLAEVNILTPKAYKLQFTHEDKEKARTILQNYLDSQKATEIKPLQLGAHNEE